jgi:flagellar biosynthesis protein FlhG
MADQADGLRRLIQARANPTATATALELVGLSEASSAPSRLGAAVKARSLVLTSGKGGVGTSNLALNLAIALGELGHRVVLVDADLGLANIDLLCGLTPPRDLGDVLAAEGTGALADAVIEGPAGVRILAGAHGMRTLPEALSDAPARLAAELVALERTADLVVVDAGSGLTAGIATLAAAADEVAVVTTPEPTSVADAHATIGRFRRLPGVRLRAVVNQARSTAEARDVLDRLTASSRQFLGAVVAPLGHVRFDPRVAQAVRARTPFLLASPHTAASRCVRRLARDWSAEVERDRLHAGAAGFDRGRPRAARPGFFAALAARWALSRVSL